MWYIFNMIMDISFENMFYWIEENGPINFYQ